ncbi:MAG: L,D-transpeptidase family protein [Bacteroidota bacterium]
MNIKDHSFFTGICFICLVAIAGCKNKNGKPSDTIANTPQELQQKAPDLIHSLIDNAIKSNNKTDDSIALIQLPVVQVLYEKNNYIPVWSKEQQWLPLGDSLFQLITHAQLLGLFPEDYHQKDIAEIRESFFNDSSGKKERKNVSLWSKADVLLTDAFAQIIKDIKLGRLPQDSITLRKDSVLDNDFFSLQLAEIKRANSFTRIIAFLEPRIRGYRLLKEGIKTFLDSADFRNYTVLPSTTKDTGFKKALQRRLFEGGFIATDTLVADSSTLAAAVKKFQLKSGITVDGQVGSGTIRMLNLSDREKFIRIAISMDKFKMLPEKMPPKYIWVNLPGFNLQLIDNDSVKISSKIICGKPLTRSPQLTSAISEMITYPQWTIPTSIIVKEILPAVKKNPGYLHKKGFSLIDKNGDEVDPYTVDWTKYSKGIPYKVVQGSGDDNALGILKFNFSNKYAVYLHDTNQRYLFGLIYRALSHGCIRVQEWQQLANYIIQNDRQNSSAGNSAKGDSLLSWLRKKEKHSIPVQNRIPLFIRYLTCEGKNGGIVFYDDIYNDDKWLQNKYFSTK